MRRRRRNRHASKWRLVLALVLIAPLVSGCWDRIEMEKRAMVLGLAIDVPKPEDVAATASDVKTVLHNSNFYKKLESKQAIEVTAQIAVPGRIPLGPGKGDGSQPETAVWVVHAFGISLGDALQELQQHIADRVFLGHLRVINISDTIAAQQGLNNFLDYLRRNPEVRRTAWLTVSKGRADALMKTAPPLERVPTLYLLATMQSAVHMGKLPPDFLGTVESKESMWGRDPVLPYLSVRGNQVDILGVAAFRQGKMVYCLDPSEETIFQQLDGARAAATSIIVPVSSNGFVIWRSFARNRRFDVRIANGVPHVRVYVHVDGNIVEKSKVNIDLRDPKLIDAVETRMQNYSQVSMLQVLNKSQEKQADIVGIGEYVRAKQPGYWRSHVHSPDDWRKLYPQVTFEVRAVGQTHRSGMQL